MFLLLAACSGEPDPFGAVPSTLLVTDRAGDAIVAYDGVTGELRGIVVDGDVDRPSSVRVRGELMYVAGFGHGEIARYAMTGAAHDVFFADTGVLEEPVELVFTDDDRLVVLGHDTKNAVVIDPSGAMLREFGYPHMAGAHDAAIGPDGMLYVGTDDGIQIWDLDAGAQVRTFGASSTATITGLGFVDDALYAVDNERDTLVRFSDDTATILADDLEAPVAVDRGPDGSLVVLDGDGIHRFDPHTGARLSKLVPMDRHVVGARSFTFVVD